MLLVYEGLYGSQLYGLATKDSDTDYRRVYVPSDMQLIKDKYDRHPKMKDAGDIQAMVVSEFVHQLEKCKPEAIDMLFTPDKFISCKSSIWQKFQDLRYKMITAKLNEQIKAMNSQLYNYRAKVERYTELCGFYQIIKNIKNDDLLLRIKDVDWETLIKSEGYKYISVDGRYIIINGAKYDLIAYLDYLVDCVENKIGEYGDRTKASALRGEDYKALSHAYRIIRQTEELLLTGNIVFPLVYAPDIMKIKLGQVEQSEYEDMLSSHSEYVDKLLGSSKLPEKPDIQKFWDVLYDYYFKV